MRHANNVSAARVTLIQIKKNLTFQLKIVFFCCFRQQMRPAEPFFPIYSPQKRGCGPQVLLCLKPLE